MVVVCHTNTNVHPSYSLFPLQVTVVNCEFGQTELTETTISCTGSDLTVCGSYLQGVELGQAPAGLDSQGIGASLKSVVRVENNYIYKTGTGVAAANSDISCSR